MGAELGEYSIPRFETKGFNSVKNFLKKNPSTIGFIIFIRGIFVAFTLRCIYLYGRFIKTSINLRKNNPNRNRKLEIGPGAERIPGFETVNVVFGRNVDYIADASKKLPFADGSFQIVYASHVLEHTAWYDISNTLTEWIRVLNHGGSLEIWVPDGYKLSKLLCDIEEGKSRVEWNDDWRPLNPESDPYKWVNGRMLYGARSDYPSWHLCIITPKYLESLLSNLGLVDIERLSSSDVRGIDHGWINLGLRGRKP